MANETLPEEIILQILSWLPVKSLLRFTCVSKSFHSTILSDPTFAKSQFQSARDRKTLTQRVLGSPFIFSPEFFSVAVESPSPHDHSSVSTHTLPLTARDYLLLFGSCNGIVFFGFYNLLFNLFWASNPSTNFFKKLPDFPELSLTFFAYGVGYLPATDDYRVLIVSTRCPYDDWHVPQGIDSDVFMFSSKAKAWNSLEVDFHVYDHSFGKGIFLKESLHWLDYKTERIVAFDLSQEDAKPKCREILLPQDYFSDDDDVKEFLAVGAEGKLCAGSILNARGDSISIWVMGEYGVCESWTKRFDLKFSVPPSQRWDYRGVFVLETCIVANILIWDRPKEPIDHALVKIGQEEGETCCEYIAHEHWYTAVLYQESLLKIEF